MSLGMNEEHGKKRWDGPSGAMREPPRITEEDLLACLQDQYDLSPVTLTFLPLGHDYDAGIYRVASEQGTAYALKVTTRSLYEPRCLVPRYLNDQGIASVVAPIPTRSSALWTQLSDWTVIVYPWISGDSSLTGMTDEQWKQVGTIFQRIHQVMLPPGGFASLRRAGASHLLGGASVHDSHGGDLPGKAGSSAPVATIALRHLSRRPACKESDPESSGSGVCDRLG